MHCHSLAWLFSAPLKEVKVFPGLVWKTREGTERVEVSNDATVGHLRHAIETNLGIPFAEQSISRDQRIVRFTLLRCFPLPRSLQQTLRKRKHVPVWLSR